MKTVEQDPPVIGDKGKRFSGLWIQVEVVNNPMIEFDSYLWWKFINPRSGETMWQQALPSDQWERLS